MQTKTARAMLIFSLVGALAVCAVGAYGMFLGPERMQLEGKSLQELYESGELEQIAIIAVGLIITAAAFWATGRRLFPAEIKNAVTAPAKVLKVWDTGTWINDNPQVGLLLEVTPAGGPAFRVEAEKVVSPLEVAFVKPGATAQVKYDAQNTRQLEVLEIDTRTAARAMELNTLRDKGLITEEEYREKREEILRGL